MSSSEKDPKDVEAPEASKTEEDPSVVVTEDDDGSSVGSKEAMAAASNEVKRRQGLSFYGPLTVLIGLAAVVLMVALYAPSKTSPASQSNSMVNVHDPDDPECNKNKTQAPIFTVVENAQEPEDWPVMLEGMPTELPFPNVAPIQAFSDEVLKGYNSVQDLQDDLTVAAKHILNRVILQNVYNDLYYASQGVWQTGVRERPVEEEVPEVAQEAAQTVTAASASASKTNNQEENADEADLVKNDENYVYASFGDYLVVWDHQGKQTTQVNLRAWDNPKDKWDWLRTDRSFINGILLTSNNVVVMVESGVAEEGVLMDKRKRTLVYIYSKPNSNIDGEMKLLNTMQLNGYYRDGRWMEDTQTLQLVTSGDVSVQDSLIQPMRRRNFEATLTSQEYIEAAVSYAETTVIPEFVQELTDAFLVNGEKLPNFLQLNSWTSQAIVPTTVEQSLPGGQFVYGHPWEGPLGSFLQITAMDENAILIHSNSVVLSPTSQVNSYATGNHWVLAMMHRHYNEENEHIEEDMFLVHLNKGSFHSVANLPGRINSPYSLDIQGNDLRVATTHQKWFPMDQVFPLCGEWDSWTNPDECVSQDNWDQCFRLAINGCPEIIKTGCPYEYTCARNENAAEGSSTDNHVIVFDISTPGTMAERGRVRIGDPHEVITAVRFGETFSYAMTFDQRDPFYVLKLEPGQAPEVVGSLKLDGFSRYLHPLNEDATLLVGIGQNVTGTGLEQVTSGVMITVFDVSDPANPVAVASRMLEDEDHIESVSGAEWDPKAVQYTNGKLVIPVKIYHYSGWEEVGGDDIWFNGGEDNFDDMVEAEEPAVSRNEDTEEGEKEDFEGFIVFTVGYTGIQEAFRVNHMTTERVCPYCDGGLMDSRSILFDDGNLMTMSGEKVQSNDIYTGETLWNMTVVIEECCW